MPCEICGKEGSTVEIQFEGNHVYACSSCSSLGRRIEKRHVSNVTLTSNVPGPDKVLVKNFGEKIRHAREAKGLTREDFAKKIFEKESFLHKVEGSHRPSDALAKKISDFLNVALFETVSVAPIEKKLGAEKMTLWDLVKK